MRARALSGEISRKLRSGGRVRVYRDAKTEWRWSIAARNGVIVAASSEGFIKRDGAVSNMRRSLHALSEALPAVSDAMGELS